MPPPHPFTVVERYSATAQLLHWTTACPGKHSALDSQSWQLGLVLAPHARVVRPRRIVGVLATDGQTIHRVKRIVAGRLPIVGRLPPHAENGHTFKAPLSK